MSFFTKFSLKNMLAVIILIVLVVAGGIYSATQLQEELYPNISPPMAMVTVDYPNASAAEVQEKVSKPIQQSIQSIQGVQDVTSTSMDNYSMTQVTFDMNENLDIMTNKIEKSGSTSRFGTTVCGFIRRLDRELLFNANRCISKKGTSRLASIKQQCIRLY